MSWTSPCLGVIVLALWLPKPALVAADSLSPAPSGVSSIDADRHVKTRVVTVNPLTPALATLATFALDTPTVAWSARYHRAIDDRFALSASVNAGFSALLSVHRYTVGLELGPRIAIRRSRLAGLFIMPMVLVGTGWTRLQGETRMVSLMLEAVPRWVMPGTGSGWSWSWAPGSSTPRPSPIPRPASHRPAACYRWST